MFTICIHESLLDPSGTGDSLTPLHDAIIGTLKCMRPTDLVCYNIGNSSKIIDCDFQTEMIKWEKLPDRLNQDVTTRDTWKELIDVTNRPVLFDEVIKPDQIINDGQNFKMNLEQLASTIF